MPCNDGGGPLDYWELALRHNSPTAEAFCELMRYIETYYPALDIPPAAAAWWVEHKHRDAAKAATEAAAVERERARAEALSKLSPADLAALGLRR